MKVTVLSFRNASHSFDEKRKGNNDSYMRIARNGPAMYKGSFNRNTVDALCDHLLEIVDSIIKNPSARY